MLHRIAVSPKGRIGLIAVASELSSPIQSIHVAPEILAEFQASVASGLATLSASRWQSCIAEWPAEFGFWRNYARSYFASLCREYSSTSDQWSPVIPPDGTALDDWLQLAPPMPGLEYLSPQHLQELWHEIDAYTRVEAKRHNDGLTGFLKSLDANWNLIGRVTFHLAENKKNADAPFAFMATYTQGQTKEGQSKVAGTHKKPAVGVDKTRKIKSS